MKEGIQIGHGAVELSSKAPPTPPLAKPQGEGGLSGDKDGREESWYYFQFLERCILWVTC